MHEQRSGSTGEGTRPARRWLQSFTLALGFVVAATSLCACADEPAEPRWVQQALLVPSDVLAEELPLLAPLSLAVRGNMAVVGTGYAIYVFERSDGVWTERAKLTSDQRVYGGPLILSGDMIAIRGPAGMGILTRTDGAWTEQADAVVGAGPVAGDGNVLLVGTEVFVRRQGEFVKEASLSVDSPTLSSAVSGVTALVGTLDFVKVFDLTADSWSGGDNVGKLLSDRPVTDVSLDGNTALLNPLEALALERGAQVFVRHAGNWEMEAEIVPEPGPEGTCSSASVALSGNTVLLGCAGGAPAMHRRRNGQWTKEAELPVRLDGNSSVALSGHTVLVAPAPEEAPHGVRVFARNP